MLIDSNGLSNRRPTFETAMSTGPKAALASATRRPTSFGGSETSAMMPTARPPASRISETVRSTFSREVWPLTTTAAPASARRRAMAAPMFCPDPVMIATRPSRFVSCMAGISALLCWGWIFYATVCGNTGSDDEPGQSRHFGRWPTTSGLPPETDIVRDGRHVEHHIMPACKLLPPPAALSCLGVKLAERTFKTTSQNVSDFCNVVAGAADLRRRFKAGQRLHRALTIHPGGVCRIDCEGR